MVEELRLIPCSALVQKAVGSSVLRGVTEVLVDLISCNSLLCRKL